MPETFAPVSCLAEFFWSMEFWNPTSGPIKLFDETFDVPPHVQFQPDRFQNSLICRIPDRAEETPHFPHVIPAPFLGPALPVDRLLPRARRGALLDRLADLQHL